MFTRNGRTSEAACYVNGVRQFTFADTNELAALAVPTNSLWVLVDDLATGQYESGPGRVRQLEIFAGALTAAEVATLHQAPPPRLAIAKPGGRITVAWTHLVYGFELEAAPAARPEAVWQPVNAPARIEGLRQSIEIPTIPDAAAALFRLRKSAAR